MTRPTPPFPQPIALDDLCQTTFPPTDWIIQGLLPAGLTLLAGKLRTGKSHLARQLAFSVATGQPALDKFPTERATVLYLGLDDIPRRMVEYSHQQLQACPPPHNFYWQNTWPPLADGGLDALETWLQQNPTTRLVVIDSFSHLNPPTHKSASSSNAAILTALKRIADSYHLSILLTHQIRQSNPKDPLSALAGTPEFASIPDSILLLHPDYSHQTASIHFSGYDLEPRTLTLAFDTNDSRWTLSHNSFFGYTLTPPRIDILNALHAAGRPLSPSEIAAALNREPARISRLLYSMVRSGLVHAVETSRYIPLVLPHETSSQNFLSSILSLEPDTIPSTLPTEFPIPPEISQDESPECRNVGMSLPVDTSIDDQQRINPYYPQDASISNREHVLHQSLQSPAGPSPASETEDYHHRNY